ncbi:hypothetical protein ACIBQ6_36095 [Nonomuraea sp. NPDC049655]|uniref:hypothetical protein n=1 Tax=Nonomuraea sp. NPDC049655 TaxID=3364355 RepID=UPI0037B5ACC9
MTEQQDVEHLMLLTGDGGVPFVMTAGPESMRVWAVDGDTMAEVHESLDEPVTDVAVHHWPGQGFTLVAGTDDGLVHVLDSGAGTTLTVRTLSHDLPIASVTIAVAREDRYAVVSVDDSGQLASWALDRHGGAAATGEVAQVPWMQSAAIGAAGPDGPIVLTATDDGRVLTWDVGNDAALTPTGHNRAPTGKLVHLAANDTTVAMAYSSGSVLFADPGHARFDIAELNVNLSAFGHVQGRGWFLAAHERTVVALDGLGPGTT